MSEEAAFLSAIDANPDDDTTRLVYADWLDDRDDPRAEYLRSEVRRRTMSPRERKKTAALLEEHRQHAHPDWLSRIDRVNRFCRCWQSTQCRAAEMYALTGQPLSCVRNNPLGEPPFPRDARVGDYIYVTTFCNDAFFLVARTRITRLSESGDSDSIGSDNSEGTVVRFDLPIPFAMVQRFTFYRGKSEATLPMTGNRLNVGAMIRLATIRRLTPRTASDLDALLRGDSLS